MLKTVRDACELETSTLDYQAAAGVESLEDIIHADDEGREFFNRNYMTRGMEELLSQGLRRLAGQTDQAIFELMQAMGGGKTHLMSALGLLARFPKRRSEVLTEDMLDRIDDAAARVAVFDGRNSPENFLWGHMADQLDASEKARPFWKDGPRAPDKQAWKEIIGEEPTLFLLDELPSYFLEAKTISVGGGTLVDVLTRALSNLFAAAIELPHCCIVLSNLQDSYHEQTNEIRRLVSDLQQEASRQARKITPVSLEGDEIYAIIRTRLFSALPTDDEIDYVAQAFSEQIKAAEDGGYFTARSIEQVSDEIRSTYPFHPAFKHLVALFKDNPDFRETRGLLQFAARLIRSVWNRDTNDVFLIGTQHLELNDNLVSDEVININRALQPAITHDVADNGNAFAEQIDNKLSSDAASQVASLILSSSLSLSVRRHAGLSREEIVEYLVAPNRKPEEFIQAFDQFRGAAWYLHHEGNAFFFKETENLRKRITRQAEQLAQGKVDKELRRQIEGLLQPQNKVAYQDVLVMPKLSEIELQSHRVLVVVNPAGDVTFDDIDRFYDHLANKNLMLILSGHDTHMASRVEETLRELIAIQSILKELNEGESLYAEAQEEYESAEESFTQALSSTFNRLLYPGADGLQRATIENGLKFGEGDNNAEQQIEKLLASPRCDKKLEEDILEDPIPHFNKAEVLLWPSGDQRRTPWRDVLMRARTNPEWPWLPGQKGLETLKSEALKQGRWRDRGDGHIEKGPFPKEQTDVNIVPKDEDTRQGIATLELQPRHAGSNPRVHYSTKPEVSESDPVVDDLENFQTDEPTLYFLAVDPDGNHDTGESKRWVANLKIRHQVHDQSDQRTVELAATHNAEVRYTLDGSNPREGTPYDGPIPIHDDELLLQVYAVAGEAEARGQFRIPRRGQVRPDIDDDKPATLKFDSQRAQLNTTEAVFDLINTFRERNGILFHGVTLTVGEGESSVIVRFGDRALSPSMLEHVVTALRESLEEPDARVAITVRDEAKFGLGYDLKRFAEMAEIELSPDKVIQE